MKTLPLCSALVAALALSACQDPAGVGLGLIGEEGGRPTGLVVTADTAETLPVTAPAIGFAEQNTARAQPRALVGSVVDPVFGDARATAYLDAVQPTVDGRLEPADVRAVWVELRRTYAYGDTTTALPLALRQITGTWSADTSYPADTTLATGPVLATATATTAPADTLVRFDLPQAWVRENAAVFLADDADFLQDFEGFAVGAAEGFVPAPGAVYGFSTLRGAGSAIRVAVTDDTLTYAFGEVFTSIETAAPLAPPPGALAARALTAVAAVRFDFSEATSGGPLPLARATLKVPVEASLAQSGSFVRPLARRVQVVGVRPDETRVAVGELELRGGEMLPSAAFADLFTRRLQEALVEEAEAGVPFYSRFELVFPPGEPASLDVFPVLRPDAVGERPRFALTVIGTPA